MSPRAISMTTLSKAYGLPGIRIRWIAGTENVIKAVRAVREQITICNNMLGESIAQFALERKDEMLKTIREQVIRNFEMVKQWMNRQSVLEWVKPKGGVVAFPRLRNGTTTEELCRLLVTKYRTFTIPAFCFGMDRYLRIGFGGESEELREGLKRVTAATNEHLRHLRE
jgi:aspartate/methionine/tyrosine aminotransferase